MPSHPPVDGSAAPSDYEISTWSITEQGSFVTGRCAVCGFVSPARRARSAARSDMQVHVVICHAILMADIDEMDQASDVSGAAAAGREVASGRERLSALGRS